MLAFVVVWPVIRLRKVIPPEGVAEGPEMTVVLVSAFWVATRRMINNGARTLKQPTSDYRTANEIIWDTHLNLGQYRQKDIGSVVVGSVCANK